MTSVKNNNQLNHLWRGTSNSALLHYTAPPVMIINDCFSYGYICYIVRYIHILLFHLPRLGMFYALVF